jgi:hypothetical protein
MLIPALLSCVVLGDVLVPGMPAPAFTADLGFKVVANFGQLPLKHAPPDDTYVSVHTAAQK